MRDRSEHEADAFAAASRLIEEEKAAALAGFDGDRFRAAVLRRIEARPRATRWVFPGLALAGGLAVLIALQVVRGPGRSGTVTDPRLVEQALRRTGAWRPAAPSQTPGEPAVAALEWTVMRGLLAWHRGQGGPIDVERALTRVRSSGRPAEAAALDEATVRGSRERLEDALLDLERKQTIYRALWSQRRAS